jgi:hypothetical protein
MAAIFYLAPERGPQFAVFDDSLSHPASNIIANIARTIAIALIFIGLTLQK